MASGRSGALLALAVLAAASAGPAAGQTRLGAPRQQQAPPPQPPSQQQRAGAQPQAGAGQATRLGRPYPSGPLPRVQRREPGVHVSVVSPQESNVHQKVGRQNRGTSSGRGTGGLDQGRGTGGFDQGTRQGGMGFLNTR